MEVHILGDRPHSTAYATFEAPYQMASTSANYRFQTEADFDFLSAEYRDLYDRSRATPFQQPTWLAALSEQVKDMAKRDMAVLTIRECASGQLILLLPLVRRKIGPFTILEYANLGYVDYAAMILDQSHWARLLEEQDLHKQVRAALGRYDLLWVKHLRGCDVAIFQLFHRADQLLSDFSGHSTQLGTDFEQWRTNTISAKRRGILNRARKALRKTGDIEFAILQDEGEISKALQQLQQWRGQRFAEPGKSDPFQEADRFAFYQTLAWNGAKDETAITCELKLDGKPAAIGFGICNKDHYVYLLPGADYSEFGKYSPGLLMLEDLLAYATQKGWTNFDFSIGDEGYKAQFGTQPATIHSLAHPRTIFGRGGLLLIKAIRGYRSVRQKSAQSSKTQVASRKAG